MSGEGANALIIGCGYLGQVLARALVARGVRVRATTRRDPRGHPLEGLGVQMMRLDVTDPGAPAFLAPVLGPASLDVYYLVPPGRSAPEATVREGIARIAAALAPAGIRRGVLASSTAVYGQRRGAVVSAETEPAPEDGRGRLLLEGERLWLAAGSWARVLRLAGIYGPGRIIGRAAVAQGDPVTGDADALLNLIHVEDAAQLLMRVAAADTAEAVELGADGHPVARREYYAWLATQLGVAPPPMPGADLAPGRTASRACDPGSTCRRTGWSPRYPDYRRGVLAALAAA